MREYAKRKAAWLRPKWIVMIGAGSNPVFRTNFKEECDNW